MVEPTNQNTRGKLWILSVFMLWRFQGYVVSIGEHFIREHWDQE